MSSNYKETSVVGTKYTRSNRVKIHNPLGSTSSIVFNEENVVITDDGVISERAGSISESLTNPLETFDIRNPETDEVIGTMTYQEVYVALYSLYRHLADKRDSAKV